MKAFVISTTIFAICPVVLTSCLHSVDNDSCLIDIEECSDVINTLIKSDTLIFKGLDNKDIALLNISFSIKEKVSNEELPPVPMGGTILLSDIILKNSFTQDDVTFIKCQLNNQKDTREILTTIFPFPQSLRFSRDSEGWGLGKPKDLIQSKNFRSLRVSVFHGTLRVGVLANYKI